MLDSYDALAQRKIHTCTQHTSTHYFFPFYKPETENARSSSEDAGKREYAISSGSSMDGMSDNGEADRDEMVDRYRGERERQRYRNATP